MKIAMIIEAWKPIWGGGQAVAYNLAKYLSEKQNCKVDLYVMNLSGKNKNHVEKINNNFNIIYTGKEKRFSFFDRICWIFELIKLVKNNNKIKSYNYIFAHANLPGIPAKILSKKLKIPSIYQVHGSGIEAMKKMYGDNLKSNILFFIENFIQTKIKYDLQLTVDKLFLKRKNINKAIFIPNGVNLKSFENIDKINKKNKDGINFLFVGRLHPQKGLIYLIKAINLLKNKLNNHKFIIVGEGEEENILKKEITKLKLERFFEFRGKKSGIDLINEYYKADVFILPSLFEGFPLTLLEAWACKLAVLVTNVGENENVIKNGINGWLSDVGDYKDLTKNIKKVIQLDKKELNKIGENGYELVKEKYNLDKINGEIFNKIKEINE